MYQSTRPQVLTAAERRAWEFSQAWHNVLNNYSRAISEGRPAYAAELYYRGRDNFLDQREEILAARREARS